jgi:hypothetical protein
MSHQIEVAFLFTVLSLAIALHHFRIMFRPEDIDEFNKEVGQWGKGSKTDLVQEMNSLGIVHRENSNSPVSAQKALKMAVRNKAGVASKISFKMPRHMVFVHKGVGRGTKITDVGSTNRKAKPWFNPVIEKNLPELVDIVADNQGTMVLNAVMIK